ncbi:hypothetical protein [Glutamicibacter sp. JC586]|uniref:hypothetical protein n=1 Tax=Glutamicibacter sp. JC586 TaxID=2590552 RepID=UPI0013595FB8|nr:hypothetical protein [Glutamicibacter sp. JC586]
MAFSVLPIIDRQTGQVQFKAQDRWHVLYVCDPARLEQLITRSSSRPTFEPTTSQLVLHIASIGHPEGRSVAFSLAKFPSLTPLTKMNS